MNLPCAPHRLNMSYRDQYVVLKYHNLLHEAGILDLWKDLIDKIDNQSKSIPSPYNKVVLSYKVQPSFEDKLHNIKQVLEQNDRSIDHLVQLLESGVPCDNHVCHMLSMGREEWKEELTGNCVSTNDPSIINAAVLCIIEKNEEHWAGVSQEELEMAIEELVNRMTINQKRRPIFDPGAKYIIEILNQMKEGVLKRTKKAREIYEEYGLDHHYDNILSDGWLESVFQVFARKVKGKYYNSAYLLK